MLTKTLQASHKNIFFHIMSTFSFLNLDLATPITRLKVFASVVFVTRSIDLY